MKPSPTMLRKFSTPVIANKINHVTLVLDTSASMQGRDKEVVKATDHLIHFLANRSKEMDQETRITVYLFDKDSECVIYDKDVLRMPSLTELYHATGPQTNLIGASIKALDEAKDISERYGDHAFLFYVFTDGEENARKALPGDLLRRIQQAPDNYTLATLVPDDHGADSAERYGFPRSNIQVWDTSKSVEEVGRAIVRSTETFYQARAAGIRGTKNLFTMDLSGLTPTNVKVMLDPIRATDYKLYPIKRTSPISEFVSFYEGAYIKGKSFYELTKPETVQANKAVAIKENSTGKVYVGSSARQMLGLPSFDVKVQPSSHPSFKIFIQSTSVNRKLIKGTEVLVMKSSWI